MNWITIAWPMVAAACLTLGLIELGIGFAHRPRAARMLFSLSAFAMAASAGLELALLQAQTLASAQALLHALYAAVGVVLVAQTAFIWVYFGTGNKWLALAAPGLYAVVAASDVFSGSDRTYQTITGLKTVETFGGVAFRVVERVPNPWNAFAYLGALALIAFVADASVRLWRRGERQRALVVGGAVILFTLTASVHSVLVDTGFVRTPYLFSWAYIAILLAMASELHADVLTAAKVAAQLHESERRMDLASAAADLGIWSWDTTHDRIWATSRVRSLFGIAELGAITPTRFLSALHPDDREAAQRDLTDARTFIRDNEAEYRVLLPDGKTRWVALRGQVERDAKGRPVLMRGVAFDISARRAAQIEMGELRSELAHASRVSMMGQLASGLAHELSQPLGAILRNAEAAELFLQQEPPDLDELRAILADIRQDDHRAANVINRLRAVLRRRSLAPRALPVNEMLANVSAILRVDALTRHTRLEVEVAPGLPMIMGESVQLQQVLLNLVLNGMDAVDGAPEPLRSVTVRAQRHGERVVEFAVCDCGSGISPERLGKLFEPFFTTKENGLGVGLSICRTIVEAHGGRIWAENNAREGATFRFTLPTVEERIAS